MKQDSVPVAFDEQQLSRLGLLHPPFSAEGFIFEDSDLKATFNLAVHLLQSSNRLVILSGPKGVGRTTFLRQVAAIHSDELDCCALIGSPQLRITSIAQVLAMRLGASDLARESETLALRLRQAEAAGYRPALVIDDAHLLDRETIQGLLSLRETVAGSGARLPTLLSAPSGAERELLQLTAALADQDERSVITLPAFSEEQTLSYIDQQLAAAGESTGRLLSARQKKQIHQQTRGLPANINLETARILMDTTRKRDPSSGMSNRRPSRLYAGVAAAMILLVGGLLLLRHLGGAKTTSGQTHPVQLALPSQQDTGPANPPRDQTSGALADNADSAASQSPAPDQAANPVAPSAGQGPDEASPPSSAPLLAQKAPAESEPSGLESAPATSKASLPQIPVNTPDPAMATKPAPGKPTGAVEAQPKIIAPATESTPASETPTPPAGHAKVAEPSPAPSPQSTPPHTGTDATTAVANRTPAPIPTAKPNVDWLATRAGNHFTIQLIAGYEKQTLERFLSHHPLGNKAHLVQTSHDGRSWHVLITGDYPSRSAARNALHRLPKDLRDNGSWVRSFASLRP